ncbi:MAG: glycosyltransferase involved in cell wall biosynthesis [Ulvibacter sp.]
MLKRVLIITYYWPPAGGPGVQRWLQFVKYFKDFDIEPVVYVPENPSYPLLDESFEVQVPSDVSILKLPINEPYRFAKVLSRKKTKQISSGIISNKKQSLVEKLMLFVRGNFFIPDARIGWVKPSVTFLKKYISENPVDVIITSGPPHSLHLVGLKLKKELNLKWIADFRDPWTTIHYHKSLRLMKKAKRKHEALEKEILSEANLIVVTSPTTKIEFEVITKKPIEVITNGYSEFAETPRVLDTSFSISHIGSLLSERNPKVLWEVLSEITLENNDFKRDLELKLAGIVSKEIVDSIANVGLKANCKLLGYVSHSEAIQLQQNSGVLLLVEIDSEDTKSIIPGKLFEYLAAGRPILALGPKGSDIEGIINETKSGRFYNYSQTDALKSHLLELYSDFKIGSLAVSSEGIEKYSRRELTKRMSEIIKSL